MCQFSSVIQSFTSSLARNIIIFLFSSYFCLGRPNVLTMSFLSLRLFLLLFLLDLAMILSMPIPSRIPHSINKILFHFAGYKIKQIGMVFHNNQNHQRIKKTADVMKITLQYTGVSIKSNQSTAVYLNASEIIIIFQHFVVIIKMVDVDGT